MAELQSAGQHPAESSQGAVALPVYLMWGEHIACAIWVNAADALAGGSKEDTWFVPTDSAFTPESTPPVAVAGPEIAARVGCPAEEWPQHVQLAVEWGDLPTGTSIHEVFEAVKGVMVEVGSEQTACKVEGTTQQHTGYPVDIHAANQPMDNAAQHADDYVEPILTPRDELDATGQLQEELQLQHKHKLADEASVKEHHFKELQVALQEAGLPFKPEDWDVACYKRRGAITHGWRVTYHWQGKAYHTRVAAVRAVQDALPKPQVAPVHQQLAVLQHMQRQRAQQQQQASSPVDSQRDPRRTSSPQAMLPPQLSAASSQPATTLPPDTPMQQAEAADMKQDVKPEVPLRGRKRGRGNAAACVVPSRRKLPIPQPTTEEEAKKYAIEKLKWGLSEVGVPYVPEEWQTKCYCYGNKVPGDDKGKWCYFYKGPGHTRFLHYRATIEMAARRAGKTTNAAALVVNSVQPPQAPPPASKELVQEPPQQLPALQGMASLGKHDSTVDAAEHVTQAIEDTVEPLDHAGLQAVSVLPPVVTLADATLLPAQGASAPEAALTPRVPAPAPAAAVPQTTVPGVMKNAGPESTFDLVSMSPLPDLPLVDDQLQLSGRFQALSALSKLLRELGLPRAVPQLLQLHKTHMAGSKQAVSEFVVAYAIIKESVAAQDAQSVRQLLEAGLGLHLL